MSVARTPTPRVGIVSDRRRLCAAAARPLDAGRDLLLEQVCVAWQCGVEFFQVREPDLDGGPLLALVRALQAEAGGRLRVVVNDRADVAAAAGAGLHLKRASLPLDRLRAWLPKSTWVSRAVHGHDDLTRAGAVDAVIAGTLRATPSKAEGTPWLGVDGVARLASASAVPVFAIGGVTAADWPALAAGGVAGIAAIGWFLPRGRESVGDAVARAMTELAAVVDGRPGVS